MSAIPINKGECVRAEIAWTNEDGSPIDLTGRTLSVVESYPAALGEGTVTVTDAEGGLAELFIAADAANKMGAGRVNWLRLGMSLPGGCVDTTPRIWIEVI